MPEPKAVSFNRFGGLRLDQAIDEVDHEHAIYLRDVDWDGTTGKLRPRDGFQKLKAADASGPYKGLFAHSSLRLLATKRVSEESLKLVAIDREGAEKKEKTLNSAVARSTFAHANHDATGYTYMRTNTSEQKVVRFDGSEFTEPTATLNRNPPGFDAEGEESGEPGEMPKGALMAFWSAGGSRFVVANTGSAGGPGGAASSASHVWFSDPGDAESWHTDPETQAGEANYVQVGVGDGEEITALCEWGDYIFAFKETKFFVFYGISLDSEGRPKFNMRQVSLGEGSRMKMPSLEALEESSDQLACAAADAVYFCTSNGIWATTGGEPVRVSQALRPLEEISPFDGPMADFLNGETEVCRWPAAGIASLGQRLIVKRYEFLFVLDVPTGEWTCWKMPQVSIATWTGLTAAGSEALAVSALPGTAENVEDPEAAGVSWTNPGNVEDESANPAIAELTGTQSASEFLVVKNFGFSLPETAVPVGVVATIRKTSTAPNALHDRHVHLVVGGDIDTSEDRRILSPPWAADKVSTYGNPGDLWGREELTFEEVNDSGFGLAFSALNGSGTKLFAGVVWIKLTVYYLLDEAASGVRPRLFCTQGKAVLFTQPGADEDAEIRNAEWQSGFYDLGSEDEKTLEGARIWGEGDIEIDGYLDLADTASAEGGVSIEGRGQARVHEFDQTGFLFSHRLKLEPGSNVQRVVRYLRETELAGGEGAP